MLREVLGSVRSSLAWVLILTVIVAAACGGATAPAATAAPPAPTAAASAAGTPTVDAAEQALVAAAKAEGSLAFYSGLDEVTMKNLAEAFDKKYGVKVNYTRVVGSAMYARYTAEANSNQFPADLLIATYDPFFDEAAGKGWLKPMSTELVPRAREIPAKFVGKNTVSVSLALLSEIAYNTAKVPADKVPQTFKDLLDPFWKNNLYISDVKTVSIILAVYELLAEKNGPTFLPALAAQNLSYEASMVGGVQKIAAGERLGGLATQVHLNPLIATAPNAPVKFAVMKDVEFGYDWQIAFSAKSKSQNAARLFVSWILSPEGQLIYNKTVGSSVRPDVTIPGFPSVSPNFILLDVGKAIKSRSALLKTMGVPE